jgi:hypothetical protein
MRRAIEQPFKLLKIKAERTQDLARNGASVNTASICTCKIKSMQEYVNTNENSNENEHASREADTDEMLSLRNLKKLKVLRLESCVNVTNAGLFYGLDLGELDELDIKLCTNINGEFIYSMLQFSDGDFTGRILFNKLRSLNVNQCMTFREENLMFIVENAPNLRELSVSALPTVTDTLVDLLLRLKRMLVLFDVSFCPNVSESSVDKYEMFLFNEFGSKEFFLDKRFISK